MQCPSCGRENRDNAKFCRDCGATFAVGLSCSGCGAAYGPGQKFCDECGDSLATGSSVSSAAAQPSADLQDSFADGRYQVKRLLGEGGKKLVYLAHDATLDRDVAFALIKTDGLDEMSRTRITRDWPRPWAASARTPTSSQCSTRASRTASPTSSPSSWVVGT